MILASVENYKSLFGGKHISMLGTNRVLEKLPKSANSCYLGKIQNSKTPIKLWIGRSVNAMVTASTKPTWLSQL